MTAAATYPRTVYEAELDVRFNIRLFEIHGRFFSRAHYTILVLSFLSTSAAFASVFQGNGVTAGVAGAIITVLGYTDTLLDLGGRAGRHAERKAAYGRLLKLMLAKNYSLKKIEAELAGLGETDPPIIESLRRPAHNQNLTSQGRTDALTSLNGMERFMAWLA